MLATQLKSKHKKWDPWSKLHCISRRSGHSITCASNQPQGMRGEILPGTAGHAHLQTRLKAVASIAGKLTTCMTNTTHWCACTRADYSGGIRSGSAMLHSWFCSATRWGTRHPRLCHALLTSARKEAKRCLLASKLQNVEYPPPCPALLSPSIEPLAVGLTPEP